MQETLNDQPVSLAIRHTTLVRAAALLALFGAALLAFGLAVRQGVITSPLLLFVGSAVGIVWILAVMFLAMIKLDRMGAPDKNTS